MLCFALFASYGGGGWKELGHVFTLKISIRLVICGVASQGYVLGALWSSFILS